MKWGFDLDQTLDHEAVRVLANLLFDQGEEVHVITVGRLNCSGYLSSRELKVLKLDRLGVRYTGLHLVGGDTFEEAGQRKAAVIKDLGIILMIDDSSTFVKMMVRETDAVILHLKGKEYYGIQTKTATYDS